MFDVKRGDIYYADLGERKGSEQGGIRPIVVIQNDVGNKYSPTTIVAVLTSKQDKKDLPTHIKLAAGEGGLKYDSIILLEQMFTLDIEKRFKSKIGRLPPYKMLLIDMAMGRSLGISVPQVLIMLNAKYLNEIEKLKNKLFKVA